MMAITPESWTQTATTTLAWSHARVVVIQPDGTHPHARALELGERAHALRGLRETKEAGLAIPRSSVLAHARTFRLDSGLTVVLGTAQRWSRSSTSSSCSRPATSDEDRIWDRARRDPRARRGRASRCAGRRRRRQLRARVRGVVGDSRVRRGPPRRRTDASLRGAQRRRADRRRARDRAQGVRRARNPSMVGRLRFTWDRAVRSALYGADHPGSEAVRADQGRRRERRRGRGRRRVHREAAAPE